MTLIKNIPLQIDKAIKPKSEKELIDALKYCIQGISLLNESHPESMTIYLRLAYKYAISVLKKHGVKESEFLTY